MTSSEAAELITILHGAYPSVYFDGPVADTFANSFVTNEYASSKVAVNEWVQTMERWPTIAELNRMVRRIRGEADNARALNAAPLEKPNLEKAKAAFADGHRRSRERAGDTAEVIEQKLEAHMTRGIGLELPGA